jgi:hypothetical protein
MANDANMTVGINAQFLKTVNGGDVSSDHDVTAKHDVTSANNMTTGVDHHVVRDLKVDRDLVVSGKTTITLAPGANVTLSYLNATAIETTSLYVGQAMAFIPISWYSTTNLPGLPDGGVIMIYDAQVGSDGVINIGVVGPTKTMAAIWAGQWWAI